MAELREGIVISKRYELRRLVGSGGFGQVWYGFDKKLQREIAIKRLLSKGFRSSEDRDEIMEEARKIASLSHPNIVSVYDVLPHDKELILKLLAKDPADRFQTTSEALSELEYVEEDYSEQLFNRIIDYHDALKAGNETEILSTVELVEGVSLCKRKGFFVQGAFLYEKSGKDFSGLPLHLYNRMEEDYKNCKRRAGREVIVE